MILFEISYDDGHLCSNQSPNDSEILIKVETNISLLLGISKNILFNKKKRS